MEPEIFAKICNRGNKFSLTPYQRHEMTENTEVKTKETDRNLNREYFKVGIGGGELAVN